MQFSWDPHLRTWENFLELKLREIWICWGVFKDSVEKMLLEKGMDTNKRQRTTVLKGTF